MSEYSLAFRQRNDLSRYGKRRESVVPNKFSFELPSEKIARQKRKRQGILQDVNRQVDINDVVDLDDNDIAKFLRKLVGHAVNSLAFKAIILVVILFNAVDIVLQTIQSISISYSYLFFIFDHFILGIFVCELVLKWYSNFAIFWKDPWNILDFIIVLVLHVGPWVQFFSNARLLRVLRAFRAFKTLRTVTSATGLSLVVETILQSLPDMANIIILLVIFTLVLSVVGVKLFGRLVPQYFGDPLQCMFSIFVCFTQDGWVQIFNSFAPFAVTDLVTYISASLFFLVTILSAAFIIANLIVAVVTTNLEKVTKEIKEQQKSTKGTFFATTTKTSLERESVQSNTNKDETEEKVALVMLDKVLESFYRSKMTRVSHMEDSEISRHQRPLYKIDLSNVTVEKLENYFLLLIAFEQNLKEHKRLRRILAQTSKITKILNDKSEQLNMNDFESRIRRDSHSISSFMAVNERPKNEGDESPRLSKVARSEI